MRLLFMTRYYPPEISGGARRPHALVNALRQAGVDVTVCAPKGATDPQMIAVPHPSYPARMDGRNEGKPASGPKGLVASILRWARLNLLLPDPEIRWAMRAVAVVAATGQKFDWIITSNPPESLHVAGYLLKSKLGARWIGDVRDKWIENPQRRQLEGNGLRQFLERQIARICFSKLDGLLAVSDAVLQEVKAYAPPHTATCVIGHFAQPFIGAPADLPNDTYNIVHTGAVSLSNPLSEFEPLMRDFESLAARLPQARLWLAGQLSDPEIARIKASNAKAGIVIMGPVDMTKARALQTGADALALVSGSKSHALPGKFSEYFQTGKPILVSAPGPWCDLMPASTNLVTWDKASGHKWVGDPKMLDRPTISQADQACSDLLRFMRDIEAA
jgi:glycosyltransferase involved in cell wall biosynthesis